MSPGRWPMDREELSGVPATLTGWHRARFVFSRIVHSLCSPSCFFLFLFLFFLLFLLLLLLLFSFLTCTIGCTSIHLQTISLTGLLPCFVSPSPCSRRQPRDPPAVASGKRQAASGKRQAASGKRQAASGKRQAASGKRQAASGKRQAASGNRAVRMERRGALALKAWEHPELPVRDFHQF